MMSAPTNIVMIVNNIIKPSQASMALTLTRKLWQNRHWY